MARLFARHPDAVARSLEIVERCRFSLSELRYQYPDEVDGTGQTPQAKLETSGPGRTRQPATPTACRTPWSDSCATNSR